MGLVANMGRRQDGIRGRSVEQILNWAELLHRRAQRHFRIAEGVWVKWDDRGWCLYRYSK